MIRSRRNTLKNKTAVGAGVRGPVKLQNSDGGADNLLPALIGNFTMYLAGCSEGLSIIQKCEGKEGSESSQGMHRLLG